MSSIDLTLEGQAIVRHVREGSKTISEHDDDVEFRIQRIPTTTSEVEIPPSRVRFLVRNGNEYIKARRAGTPEDLIFLDRGEAERLVAWLKKKAAGPTTDDRYTLGDYTLVGDSGRLEINHPDRLSISAVWRAPRTEPCAQPNTEAAPD